MWVIKRGHMYLAQPGSTRIFTVYLQRARVFPSYVAAQQSACDNEYVIDAREEVGR
jgi:hypothetical protein